MTNSELTITERLARAGYSHERDGFSENTGKHIVRRIDTGELVGRFTACEAIKLLGHCDD